MAKLAQRLRQKRLERDVTQAQVAKAVGCTQAMIAQVEAGTKTPDDELEGKILRWLASGVTTGRAKRGAYRNG